MSRRCCEVISCTLHFQVVDDSASPTAAAAMAAPGNATNPAPALGLVPSLAASAAPPGPAPNPAPAATVAAGAPQLFHGLSADEIQQRLAEIRASEPGLAGGCSLKYSLGLGSCVKRCTKSLLQ